MQLQEAMDPEEWHGIMGRCLQIPAGGSSGIMTAHEADR